MEKNKSMEIKFEATEVRVNPKSFNGDIYNGIDELTTTDGLKVIFDSSVAIDSPKVMKGLLNGQEVNTIFNNELSKNTSEDSVEEMTVSEYKEKHKVFEAKIIAIKNQLRRAESKINCSESYIEILGLTNLRDKLSSQLNDISSESTDLKYRQIIGTLKLV